MLKKTLILGMAAVVFSAVWAQAAPKPIPNVAATVNGDKITKEQLMATLVDWQAPLVLQEMITQRLIGQEARKNGVNVTEAQVKTKLDEYKKGMMMGGDFEQMLRRSGFTLGHAFAFVKSELQLEGIARKRIKVTPQDLDEYRRASHILIKVEPTGPPGVEEKENPSDAEAKTQIEKIAVEIKGGLSFEEAASKYSQDDANKNQGGDLGFFTRADFLPEFTSAAFNLKVGEMSEPVKSSAGYHLIKVVALGKVAKGDDLKKIQDTIFQKKYPEERRTLLLSINNKAKIDNFVEPVKPEPKAAAPRVTVPAPPPGDTPPPPPPAPDEVTPDSTAPEGTGDAATTTPAETAPAQ